jgi:prepilin-type N-terminal cleavage/methylation domain-containing protein
MHGTSANRMRNEGAFTLIELLIVIVVLGILATIVLFATGGSNKDALQAACKTDLHIVQTAGVRYELDTGSKATSIEELENAGYIDGKPANVTIDAGGTVIANCDTLTPTTAPVLALTPELKASVVSAVTKRDKDTNNWSATITLRVTDEGGDAVKDVDVVGRWLEPTPTEARCDKATDGSGGCRVLSDHSTPDDTTARTWVLDSLEKDGYDDAHAAVTVSCRRSAAKNGATDCVVS